MRGRKFQENAQYYFSLLRDYKWSIKSMTTWNSNQKNYTVNDGSFTVSTSGASRQSSNTYNVSVSQNTSIQVNLNAGLYSGREQTFNISSAGGKTGNRVRINFTNSSLSGKTVSYSYNSTTNKTTLTVRMGATNAGSFKFVFDGNVFPGQGNKSISVNGSTSYGYGTLACFLRGSLIETPNGYVKVEDLRIGDEIIVYNASGIAGVDNLIWVGSTHAVVHHGKYDDEAGYPVRIEQNAISDGVPFKDLLVTSEHCLFFEGQFVPARMLVNGLSIHYDKSFSSYEYFHIETKKHSVIKADGMLTESYLDTGSRDTFSQEGTVFFLGCQQQSIKTWERDAAAPLSVAQVVVEPIYRKINERALSAKGNVGKKTVSLTKETNLYLRTERGQIIKPLRGSADKAVFLLPEKIDAVFVMSNSSRPCDTAGPFVDDRRELGICIGEISLFSADQTIALTEHLQNENLSGWHCFENEPSRWTNGEAFLPFGSGLKSSGILAIQVISAGPYLASNKRITGKLSVA
ncbi:outer membrane protein [Neokomagataea thailandica NBRC 106555]|nr:outer membrane protein [Neokomagataea thailandica NBRC 106555]